MNARVTEATNRIETIAHRWAHAAYCKALGKPFENIDAIKKELHAALAAPLSTESGEAEGWRPIETAPTTGEEVLVKRHSARAVASFREWRRGDTPLRDDLFRWRDLNGFHIRPTHWAPLPEDTHHGR